MQAEEEEMKRPHSLFARPNFHTGSGVVVTATLVLLAGILASFFTAVLPDLLSGKGPVESIFGNGGLVGWVIVWVILITAAAIRYRPRRPQQNDSAGSTR